MDNEEVLQEYTERLFQDFQFFCEEFLDHYFTSEIPDFHKQLYKLIPQEKRIVIAAPRGFAKSTISSVLYPIWLGITGHKKDICLVSHSESFAVNELLLKIKKEFETNDKLIKWFGDLRTSKWSATHIILSTGVTIRAKGAGGQIRGFRPDCLIFDDLESDDNVESEEQRKKLRNWVFKAGLNTLQPQGQFIMIGTIIHPLSLLEELLTTDQGWCKRRFQAYKDGRQEPGCELWPDLWPHKRLQEKKTEIGSFAFASEYLNNPVADESMPIKPGMIRYWKDLPAQMSIVIAVDPAYSEDEKADFKVAAVVAIDQNLNRYLVSYVRTHAPTGEFMDRVLNLWLQHKSLVTGLGVPNQGTEKEFFKSFVDKASRRNLYPPFTELKNTFTTQSGVPKRAKRARITAALQPLFESGKYYIHNSHCEARDELLAIGTSRWDDLVDAMAYAEQIITPVFLDTGKKDYRGTSEFLEKAPDSTNYGLST